MPKIIGIAMVPECGRKFKHLYDCADQALYSVKYAGKGGYCFAEKADSRQKAEQE